MDNFDKNDVIKLSLPMIIFLGLFPGIIILLIAFIFTTPIFGINFSLYLSIMLAIIIGLIPTELGILKYFAWKNNKKIKDILPYKEKMPVKKMVLPIVIPFIFALAVFILFAPYELKIWGNVFDFFPDWFKLYKVNFSELNYLKFTFVLALIFNGFLGPFVEEIYFRGFLLPRMSKLGGFAPLVNAILFSVYHFFSPWENISRIIAITPISYAVWKHKDLRIDIITHCSLNILSVIGLIISVL
jgi:membrane protease YdiL (CAAX protease family)